MEFASFFNSLGVEVHVVEMLDKILGPMDRELSEMLQAEYAKRGIKFYLSYKVTGVHGTEVSVEKDGETFTLHGDKVLLRASSGYERFWLGDTGSGDFS